VQGVDASVAEWFIGTNLTAGSSYTFTYTANEAAGLKYRCEFVAPNNPTKSFQRYTCPRVK
ncbi:MAG: hypothetical protein AB7N71_11545, partial [Phycisphaerae bacterium]